MQITTYSHIQKIRATLSGRLYSPAMHLEWEAPEEGKIRQIELDIGEARGDDERVNSLKRKRQEVYDSWIERLKREIADAEKNGKDKEKDRLVRQRERAMRDYS